MPTRAAISDCVRPSKKRSSTIARSRASSAVEAGLHEHAVLDLLVARLRLAEHVLHRLVVGVAGTERLRERAGRVRVVRLERLDDLVLVDPDRLGELRDRRRAAEVGGRASRSCG